MKYKLSNGLEHFWQWDTNQSIILPIGIPTVHFKWGGQSIKVSPSDGVCPIPDELLQVTDDLIFYTYNKDHTIDGSFIKIYARPKPDGYVYTPTEIKSFDDLDKRITALEQGGGVAGVSSVNGQSGAVTITAESLGAATSDEVTSAVNSAWTEAQKTLQPMFDAKQPKGDYLTQENLQSATNEALKQAKESGQFNGTSVNWRGEYGSTAKYEKMDAVIYDGSSYIFVGESTIGAIPGIDEEWSLMVEKGDPGGSYTITTADKEEITAAVIADGIEAATSDGVLLPSVTAADNGKIARVVGGSWEAVELLSAGGVSF